MNEEEYTQLRNSLPAGWFDSFTSKQFRDWPTLKAMCPFTAVQITPDEEVFDFTTIGQNDVAMWLTQYMTTELDIVLVLEGLFHGATLISSIRNSYLLADPRICGAIFNDEAIAALFKLTFADRLIK